MSFTLREKYHIPLRAVERGITYGIYPGDMDGDGNDELLILGERYAYLLKVFDLKNKNVDMREYVPDPANIELYVPKGGALLDYDGDGRMEIALAITLGTGASYRIGFKDLRVSRKAHIEFKINGMAHGDVDNDGLPEFVLFGDSEGAKSNLVLIKGGEKIGEFLKGLEVFSAGVGDVDGDGKNELVLSFSESVEGTTRYYLGIYKVSADLEELFKVQTSREIIRIRVADIDNDGTSEIYVMSPAKITALMYDGTRVTKLRDTPEIGGALRDFLTDDFDNDGYVETLVATDKAIVLYEHGILESTIEEEVKNRGFTCVSKARIGGKNYLVAGLDDGLRFGELI